MNSNFLEKITYSIIIVLIISSCLSVSFATSTSNLEDKKSDIQDEINDTSSEILGVKSQMTVALNEVNRLNSEIAVCENKISELQVQIEQLNLQIEEKQKNIEEQQARYEEQQRLLDKRLIAVYESGNTTYLDVLLSSSSFSDFISKYYLIEKLAKSDTELLTQIQNLKTQIENEKLELETNRTNVENSKKDMEEQKKSIQNLAKEKQAVVNSLSAEEKKLQSQLDELEQDKREIQQQIARIEAENRRKALEEEKLSKSSSSNNSSNASTNESISEKNTSNATSSVSISGFICPISGRNKNDITTGYHGYRGHTGVDFARNSKGAVAGLPVLAAKSGTVVTSVAKKINGHYYSYGEYIMISHGDGTYSVYAHMQEGSRKVKEGDKVSQGQQIGNVGSTGNSTGPHLHFEIRTLSGSVNPTQYLP